MLKRIVYLVRSLYLRALQQRLYLLDPATGHTREFSLVRGVSWIVLAMAVFAGGAGIYAFGSKGVDQQRLVTLWEADLAEQRERLAAAQHQQLAENLALARRVGTLQAELLRMKAVSSRLVDLAGIDSAEFALSEPVAVGGPLLSGHTGTLAGAAIEAETLLAPADHLELLESELAQRVRELAVLSDLMGDKALAADSVPKGRPVRNGWLSSRYGRRIDPLNGTPAWHAGVDYAGKDGSDVVAVGAGVVIYSRNKAGYGHLIEIDHGNGWTSRYAHLKEAHVELGDLLQRGSVIGAMGSTGRSTGPHVHLELFKDGKQVNPLSVL